MLTMRGSILWIIYAFFYDMTMKRYRPHQRMVAQAVAWTFEICPAFIYEQACGTGLFIRALRAKNWRGTYIGADPSPTMLVKARGNNPDVRSTAFVSGVFATLADMTTKTMDYIVCLHAPYLMRGEEAETWLSQLQRVLLPGGHVLFSALHRIDVEAMMRAHAELPPPMEYRNSMRAAVKVCLNHSPFLFLPFFLTGVIAKIAGGDTTHQLLSRAQWNELIDASGFQRIHVEGYFGGENYTITQHPGTIWLLRKKE